MFSVHWQRENGHDAVQNVIFPVGRGEDVSDRIGVAVGNLEVGASRALIDAARHDEFVRLLELHQVTQAVASYRLGPAVDFVVPEHFFLAQAFLDFGLQNFVDCSLFDLGKVSC